MIKGLGTDIIEIERIRKSLQTHGDHFIQRLFTPKEQAYCQSFQDPAPHFAGRFAAKEAIAKALGTGFGEALSFLDLEILNDGKGKPTIWVLPRLLTLLEQPCPKISSPEERLLASSLFVSISHCQSYAMASSLWT